MRPHFSPSRWTFGPGRILRKHFGLQRRQSSISSFVKISEEVRDAISTHRPVVALESTIYTHGFPKPDNVSLAFHLESIIRQNGGVPATIGVLDGVARVGLSPEELAQLTSSAGELSTLKLSRRDLSFAMGMRLAGKQLNGGTTVAGTMILAHLAGIKVFATGGLGGVHRGAESSMDISADLTELGRTPVAVISSGCKSFLDIPRTLEYLETQGVGVATFADGRGEKVDFPSFWSRDSGVISPSTVQDEYQAAMMIHTQSSLGLSSGLLFGSPIPQNHEIPKSEIDVAIINAVEQAEAVGACGKDNTPFILSKIWGITRGKSLAANRALIETNVARATKVAVILADLEKPRNSAPVNQDFRTSPTMIGPAVSNYTLNGVSIGLAHHRTTSNKRVPTSTPISSKELPKEQEASFCPADIVIAGAIAMDSACDYNPLTKSSSPIHPVSRTSNPARITHSVGGVGRNIAVAASHLGPRVLFCSARGDDVAGDAVVTDFASYGLPLNGIKRAVKLANMQDDIEIQGHQSSRNELAAMGTAQYVAINDANKDLNVAMADMSILEKIDPTIIKTQWIRPIQEHTKPKWVVLDTNWAPEGLATWLDAAKTMGAKTAVDPVSAPKSVRVFSREAFNLEVPAIFPHHKLHLLAPNKIELTTMHETARANGIFDTARWWKVIDALGIPASGARAAYESIGGKALVDEGLPQMSVQLLPLCPSIVVKMGEEGVLVTELLGVEDERLRSADDARWIVSRNSQGDEVGGVYMRLFPASRLPPEQIQSVNGVGDTFLGTLVAGLVKKNARVTDFVDVAQRASRLTLKSTKSVSERLIELKDLI